MNKVYVIQNLTTKKYWYGNYYPTSEWTEDIEYAQQFIYIEDAERQLEELSGIYFIIIQIYTK